MYFTCLIRDENHRRLKKGTSWVGRGLCVMTNGDVWLTMICFSALRSCSHDPGQLTDAGVNFASVHGLTPVIVHMSFSLPRGNFERRVTRCTTPGNPPWEVTFLRLNRTQKLPPGQEQSCACSLLMFRINFSIKSSRKHQKYDILCKNYRNSDKFVVIR